MSFTTAVLVTSIEESELVKTTVASFVVLPSVSSPSSDTSVTSLLFPEYSPLQIHCCLPIPYWPHSDLLYKLQYK